MYTKEKNTEKPKLTDNESTEHVHPIGALVRLLG